MTENYGLQDLENNASSSPKACVKKMTSVVGLSQNDEKSTIPYDPYRQRVVKHPTSNAETLLHLLKGSLGTGILAMPNAFYHAGWALGVTGTLIIGIICTYCVHLLITCEYELCKRRRWPVMNYPETAKAALLEGPKFLNRMAYAAKYFVNFFLFAYQIGSCSVYVVFVASNLKDVIDQYYQAMNIRIYMVLILLPLIFINCIRNLKYLAPLSSLANVVTIAGFGITFYYVFHDLPSISERDPIGKINEWPLFFGTVLFSLEAIGVIMPLENEMKTPESFGGLFGVLNKAMLIIIVLYVTLGFFGYLKYGHECLGSITLNIPQKDVLAQVVKLMMAFNIFVTHALQCYVAIDMTWNGFMAEKFEKRKNKVVYEVAVRAVIVVITFLFAIAVPNLELFISLVGTLCLSVLALFVPAVVEMSTYWHHRMGFEFYMMCFKDVVLICISIIALIIGCSTTISEIIDKVFNI